MTKKLLSGLAAVFLLSQTAIAQISDFENIAMPVNSFINGSANPLGYTFSSGDADFQNYYDTAWGGYWSAGWAISSSTDSTTTGAANLYGARPASGVDQSQNYAVGHQGSKIVLKNGAPGNALDGVYVTNSQYAYASMRDGDAFAKKFGGPSGNDPDYFLLTISGYKNGNPSPKKVDTYLADFRSSDNSKDFILDKWLYVNLKSLGAVDSLFFNLTSSDTSSFGLNTPAYFAIDNFNGKKLSLTPQLGLQAFNIYPNPAQDYIRIETPLQEAAYSIYQVDGVLVASGLVSQSSIKIGHLPKGAYMVMLSSEEGTFSQKLIKQ